MGKFVKKGLDGLGERVLVAFDALLAGPLLPPHESEPVILIDVLLLGVGVADGTDFLAGELVAEVLILGSRFGSVFGFLTLAYSQADFFSTLRTPVHVVDHPAQVVVDFAHLRRRGLPPALVHQRELLRGDGALFQLILVVALASRRRVQRALFA